MFRFRLNMMNTILSDWAPDLDYHFWHHIERVQHYGLTVLFWIPTHFHQTRPIVPLLNRRNLVICLDVPGIYTFALCDHKIHRGNQNIVCCLRWQFDSYQCNPNASHSACTHSPAATHNFDISIGSAAPFVQSNRPRPCHVSLQQRKAHLNFFSISHASCGTWMIHVVQFLVVVHPYFGYKNIISNVLHIFVADGVRNKWVVCEQGTVSMAPPQSRTSRCNGFHAWKVDTKIQTMKCLHATIFPCFDPQISNPSSYALSSKKNSQSTANAQPMNVMVRYGTVLSWRQLIHSSSGIEWTSYRNPNQSEWDPGIGIVHRAPDCLCPIWRRTSCPR